MGEKKMSKRTLSFFGDKAFYGGFSLFFSIYLEKGVLCEVPFIFPFFPVSLWQILKYQLPCKHFLIVSEMVWTLHFITVQRKEKTKRE